MGKNVAVFVDVANIFYAAKAAGVDIDYVTLLKSAIAGRDFVRAYAYTGLDPDNENQRNFHSFLARHDYKVVSKDIRKYGDGKVKANLDIELVVDMMKTARNLDVAIIVSGDGDFAPAIRAVQEMGVRVEVISFRGNTSSDLMDVADQFTDITQIAKVEKGSSRSGRRVADDQEDLSMTEVPDKMTEGTGRGRGRGTGRGRGRPGEAEREPAVAVAVRAPVRGVRTRRTEVEPELPAVAAAGAGGGPVIGLIALPGEKLSKAAQARLEAAAAVSPPVESEAPDGGPIDELDGEGEEAQRRRRRRGGRGRGRGRGRGEGELQEGTVSAGGPAVSDAIEPDEEELEIAASAPRGPKPAVFGSVWDSQIGQARVPAGDRPPYDGGEDEDEPAIPEYLIAEQRRGASSGRGGDPARGGGAARGGRGGAYAAAVERERYGRGSGGGGGINRYPDVSGRPAGGGGGGGGGRGGQPVRRDDRRDDRPPLSARPVERSGGGRSDEPWSEVPPELEAMLRAQLASKAGSRPVSPRPAPRSEVPAAVVAPPAPAAEASAPKRRPAARTKAAAPTAVVAPPAPAAETSAPKRRPAPRAKAAAAAPAAVVAPPAPAAEASAPKRRPAARTKAAAAAPAAVVAPPAPAAEASAPKRRPAVRKKAESTEA